MYQKTLKLSIYESLLRWMARIVLWRHKPYIIGITGSVGKTTTKDMIAHVLQGHKSIGYTKKNYNNEVGVPLTLFGIDRDVNSISGVFYTFYKWLSVLCVAKYPEIVVLEMGVDRPGDMDYLMNFVSPDISILTTIAPAHSEFFPSVEHIAQEKQKIITKMKNGGVAIVNADDRNVVNVCDKTKNRCVTYGTDTHANFSATDIEVCFQQCYTTGLSFKLNYDGKVIPVRLSNLCADHMVFAALATLAVAHELKINLIEAVSDLADFVTSPGRMRLLTAKNDALVIDDTYNASPKAMKAAVYTLGRIPAKRKIAVLGDMRELGKVSVAEHKKVATYIVENKIDAVFFVGEKMHDAYETLQQRTIEKIYFPDAKSAVEHVVKYVEQGDVILVKGSRGVHMESIVQRIVNDPSQTIQY